MLVNLLSRYRSGWAVAHLSARLQRDVGIESERVRRRYVPDLPSADDGRAPLRRLIGISLLRR